MNKYEERRKAVESFYQTHPLVLIGMNDYANSSFLTNSLLKRIEKEINAASLTIDAGSLTLNKSEHIDVMLGYNLTLEEIRIARLISLHDGISNLIGESLGSKAQSGIDRAILNPLFNPKHAKEMPRIGISDLIQDSETPIIIHSTGANNLMRIVGANPYTIERDYKNKRNNHKYKYARMKAMDEKTVTVVLDGIKRNFENIYKLNPDAQIFSLGLYLQKVFKKEKFRDFKELILRYNEALEKLCVEYNVAYIETMNPGNEHQNHFIDFNLSKRGQEELAKAIVKELYIYLDSVKFEPKHKENTPAVKYYEKDSLINAYQDATEPMRSKEFRLKEELAVSPEDKQIFGLMRERDRELKIYQKTFEEAKRRNK